MQKSLLELIDADVPPILRLTPERWAGCFNAIESGLQQLAPYVGKMKSGMASVLVEEFSEDGNTILDPFCGSGVVPLEAASMGRHVIANDLNPYAFVLTSGKLNPPPDLYFALALADKCLIEAEALAPEIDTSDIPGWVAQFFHPATLREIVALFDVLRRQEAHFFTACLLGILHHVRPGFLSYPASHNTPYLRPNMYPPEQFPEMYAYRPVRPRFLAKIRRAYRRAPNISGLAQLRRVVMRRNAMDLPIGENEVDAIISSPPYFGALDYGRDNRLRLWFLGVPDYKVLDEELTSKDQRYIPEMTGCLREMTRVLKPEGYCVLVLGDVNRNGRTRDTASTVSSIGATTRWADPDGQIFALETEGIVNDEIPDDRRSRRRTRTTKVERILIMRKVAVDVPTVSLLLHQNSESLQTQESPQPNLAAISASNDASTVER